MIKVGTVGRPLPGVSVRVDADGEVWIRGINVFRGYHGQEETTAAGCARTRSSRSASSSATAARSSAPWITLDSEMLATWAAGRGRPELTAPEAVTDAEVRAEVQRAVDEANASVSRAESIRSFTLLAEDFTIDNGMLTPSMKLKRQRITDAFEDDIERLCSRG